MLQTANESEHEHPSELWIFNMNNLRFEKVNRESLNHINDQILLMQNENCKLHIKGHPQFAKIGYLFHNSGALNNESDLEGIHPNIGERLQTNQTETVQDCIQFCDELFESMNKRKIIMSCYINGTLCYAHAQLSSIKSSICETARTNSARILKDKYIQLLCVQLEKVQNECELICDRLDVSCSTYHERIQQICDPSKVSKQSEKLNNCHATEIPVIYRKLQKIFYRFLRQFDILHSEELQNARKKTFEINNDFAVILQKIRKYSIELQSLECLNVSLGQLHLFGGVNSAAKENDELIEKLEALMLDGYSSTSG